MEGGRTKLSISQTRKTYHESRTRTAFERGKKSEIKCEKVVTRSKAMRMTFEGKCLDREKRIEVDGGIDGTR